jgi:hypothetical protein
MKKIILILIASPFLQGCNQQTGRYQIVVGTYDEVVTTEGLPVVRNNSSNISSSEQNHGVFKIDTQTGQTWIYKDALDIKTNGATEEEGWREINGLTTNYVSLTHS